MLATGCRARPKAEQSTAEESKPESEESAEHEAMPESVSLTSAAIAEAGVATWKVQPVDLAHLISLTGTVNYDENHLLQVASTVKGRVASIPVDLGAHVRAGEPLLTIESAELARGREEYARALSDLSVSRRGHERAKGLVEAKVISAGEFQAREGDYLVKKAAAEAAERALRIAGDAPDAVARIRSAVESGGSLTDTVGPPRLVVRAPFAGTVIDRKVTPGALVEAMQPLATVADLSTVWVFLQAYEKDLALIHQGLPVTIRVEAYPQEFFRGRVDFLGSVVDTSTRTVRVRATVRNVGQRLRPGMFVKAQLDVPKPEKEAHLIVAVPQSALQTLEGRVHVFVQTTPGTFVRHAVETGHTFEGFTEILSGVKAGDVVVTEGSFVVKSEFARASLVDED